MVDDEERADIGLDFIFDVTAEIGTVQHPPGKTLPARLGDGNRTRTNRELCRAGFRFALRNTMIDPPNADQRIGALKADHLAADDIRLAHEVGDEGRSRRLVEFPRRA